MPAYLLMLEDGEPADPAAFLVHNPLWNVGDTFLTADGKRFRILDIDTDLEEATAEKFRAVWTVEQLPG